MSADLVAGLWLQFGLFAAAAALRLAIDFRAGVVVGLLALVSYLAFEIGLTFNPGASWRRRRP